MPRALINRLALCALIFFAVALTGCATGEKLRGEFRYDMGRGTDGQHVYFPPPPSMPRYAYAGELIGERNFHYNKPEKSFGQKLFELLTGIGGGSANTLELLRPQAITTDQQGRVYVSDMGHAAVFVFDPVDGEARLLRRVDHQRAFVAPSGVAVGVDGQLFVADAELGLVARIDASGKTYAPIGEGVLRRPTGVVFDKNTGRLFVSDTDDSQIKVFDLGGRQVMKIGQLGEGAGEFNRPTYMAIWRDELYVTDTLNSRIQVFDLKNGAPRRTVGSRGTFVGQFAIPKGVALDTEGNLYVVESLFDHLLIFNREGKLLLPIGGAGYSTGSFYLPAGLWIDEFDRVYVADMYNGRIVTYLYLGSESESGNER